MNLWISANRSLVISSFVESGERCLVRMDHGSRVLGRRCPESRPSLRMPRMTCVTSCSGMLTTPLRANHGCMMDYLKLSRCFGYANGPTLAIGPTPTNATSTSYPGSSTTTSPARMVVSATLHPSAALFPKVQRLDRPQAPLFWWCSAKAGASFRHLGTVGERRVPSASLRGRLFGSGNDRLANRSAALRMTQSWRGFVAVAC